MIRVNEDGTSATLYINAIESVRVQILFFYKLLRQWAIDMRI